MFKKLKNIFKKDKSNAKYPSKYFVKKIVFEAIVTKDELEEILKQYKEDHKPIEAKRNGVTMVSFSVPRKYKLEIEEIYEDNK